MLWPRSSARGIDCWGRAVPHQEHPRQKGNQERRSTRSEGASPIGQEAISAAQVDREKGLRARAEAWSHGEQQNAEGAKALAAAFSVQDPVLAAEAEGQLKAVSEQLFKATPE